MTKNKKLLNWVSEVEKLCKPDSVHWCDGSVQEYDRLIKEMAWMKSTGISTGTS